MELLQKCRTSPKPLSSSLLRVPREAIAYLEWNKVPFSKYPSWCTRSMSPYLDFRWQRKGLCRTSILTSASGSFPPLTDASREEQSQLSTVSSMPPLLPWKTAGYTNDCYCSVASGQLCTPPALYVAFSSRVVEGNHLIGRFGSETPPIDGRTRTLEFKADLYYCTVFWEIYSHASRLSTSHISCFFFFMELSSCSMPLTE